jgi:hypothetical protein
LGSYHEFTVSLLKVQWAPFVGPFGGVSPGISAEPHYDGTSLGREELTRSTSAIPSYRRGHSYIVRIATVGGLHEMKNHRRISNRVITTFDMADDAP